MIPITKSPQREEIEALVRYINTENPRGDIISHESSEGEEDPVEFAKRIQSGEDW